MTYAASEVHDYTAQVIILNYISIFVRDHSDRLPLELKNVGKVGKIANY